VKAALKKLIDDLDAISEEHDEVLDTDVREQMADSVRQTFINPTPGYTLPDTYGMFSDEGNEMVRSTLQAFFQHPEVLAATKSLTTSQARLDAFQDIEVESENGNTYDEYFGYSE